ncbi:MAG TPA: hypothetical protein VMS32_05640 [Verrucomicrobiae bacterium]|jgi:hypothetical protein|nr:hypothetical protein [Verrucomicrobiae bacterium]
MSPEWVTAAATLGTFVVIAASAIAALLQLRHTRGSNQIIALTECRETLESEAFQDARQFIAVTLPQLMNDPEMLRKLEQPFFPSELRSASNVANFFESMGAFVRFNIIDRTIACDLWCGVVLSSWEALLPVTRIRRWADPGIWENFEYLAMLSKQFAEQFPTSYPRGMPRMPMEEQR